MEPNVRSASWSTLSPTSDFYYRPSGEILTGSFRIVSILPGQPGDPIVCRTREGSLHRNDIPFVALSYCWNSPVAEEEIWCDNRKLRITENLFAALRNARATGRPVSLWIDQICIDQSNIIDRNQQVSKMGAIYHAATGVVVWLGVEGHGTSSAMELPRRIERYWPELYERPELLTDRAATPDHVPAWGSPVWASFIMLLTRPWFRRLWIIQEIACAKSILITCGTAATPWDGFVKLAHIVESIHHKSASPAQMLGSKTAAQYINFMQGLRDITEQGTKPAINDYASEDSMAHHVLTMAKDCEATDHRDKLFAFHHLVRLWNKPDYGMEIEMLYNLFAVQYLQRIAYAISEYSCDFEKLFRRQLEFVYSAGSCNQRLDLPSWVPDWSVPWQAQPLWYENKIYHAGGSNIKELVPVTEVDGSGHHRFRLPVNTKLVDRVFAVAPEGLDLSRDGSDTLAEALRQWIFQAMNILHFHRTHSISYPDRHIAIARTILADQDQGRKLSPDDAVKRYDILIELLRQSAEQTGPASKSLEHERFYYSIASFLRGRVFFVSESGRFGIAQKGLAWGDIITIIEGAPVPVVIRPTISTGPQAQEYRLLCEAFVLGVMDGEAWNDHKIAQQQIVLV